MIISTFNVNKFCGLYSFKGRYYNPKNIDFKTPIKNLVSSLLKNKDDIFFLQEFCDNSYTEVKTLFTEDKYKIIYNMDIKTKSDVVAITLKDSLWEQDEVVLDNFSNKFIKMKLPDKSITVLGVHNTNELIQKKIEDYFNIDNDKKPDIILGDFNDSKWVKILSEKKYYIDLVTDYMITYKPAQTAIDRIFIKNQESFSKKIVFNGVVENFLSDHNLLTFTLNI